MKLKFLNKVLGVKVPNLFRIDRFKNMSDDICIFC